MQERRRAAVRAGVERAGALLVVGHRSEVTTSARRGDGPPDGACNTERHGAPAHEWTVAGAVLEHDDELLLVCNQRRNGSLDWSTPGGVIDATDATVLAGLTREVEEETGLVVREWEGPLYEVTAVAVDLGWVMRCEVHRAVVVRGRAARRRPGRDRGRRRVRARDRGPGPARRVLPLGARAARGVAARAVGAAAAPRVPLRRARHHARLPRGGPRPRLHRSRRTVDRGAR